MSTKPVMKSSTLDILKAQLKNSLNKQVEESKEKAAATKIEKAKTAGELLEELIANHAAGKAGRTIKSRGIALCAAVQGGPANIRASARFTTGCLCWHYMWAGASMSFASFI